MIPFSPPRVDEKIIKAVEEVLKSGWITTGPKTKLFEKRITEYTGCRSTLCLNSASAGLELVLRWFGVKEGDEVIIPAYTYCATANVVIHCGAKPVMADINDDFNIAIKEIEKVITSKTKVIMPVDIGGFPCDYEEINNLVNRQDIKKKFIPENKLQKNLGRILVMSDAAHSLGAMYKGKKTGSLTDITVFSFHAVKNLTTAEGGAICLNLPAPFDNEAIYRELCIKSLHGQTKDALAKTQKGSWQYDVTEAGYKCNMTDIQAAMGLIELERYDKDMLVRREQIFKLYTDYFANNSLFDLPLYKNEIKKTSFHIYLLRIKDINEEKRNRIIAEIFNREVSVNVHFIPLPLLSFYASLGYNIIDFPQSYKNYSSVISLPVYYDLNDADAYKVAETVAKSVETIVL